MRWLKFNAVGAMGGTVHLGLLSLFVHAFGMQYLLATALSVEAAILHNFIWHRRWTWADRRTTSDGLLAPLARFNLMNGLVSIGGNLLSAYILTGRWKIDPVIANAVSIAVGSLANLFLSDRVVFVSLKHSGAQLGNLETHVHELRVAQRKQESMPSPIPPQEADHDT